MTHLAVKLAVIDVERKRLSKGSFNLRLELLHLLGNLENINDGHPVCGSNCMHLNWVLIKDKLHQVGVLKDENFDEGEVTLAWVRGV